MGEAQQKAGQAGHGVLAFGGNRTSGARDVASALSAHGGTGRHDFESETFITHAMRGEGFDASEDGTGRGTPLVPVAFAETAPTLSVGAHGSAGHPHRQHGNETAIVGMAHAFDARQSDVIQYGDKTGPLDTDGRTIGVAVGVTLHGTDGTQSVASFTDLSSSLRARIPSGVENSTTTAVMQPVAFDTTQITSALNRSNPKPGDPCHPLAAGAHALAIAFSSKDHGGDATENLAPTLRAMPHHGSHANGGGQMAVAFDPYNQSVAPVTHTLRKGRSATGDEIPQTFTAMQVRRLTPRECERLQGFPDDYTLIPWRGKPADQCPDGPRYKALGNSWATPVVQWIGRRIDSAVRRCA